MYVPPLFYIARLLPVPVTIDEFQPIKYTESKEAGRNETDNRDIKNVELPMEPENYDEAREMVLRKRKDVKVKYEFPSREHSITSNDGYDHGNENKNKAGRLKSFRVSKNDGKGHELQLSDKNKSAGDKNSYKGDRLDMLAKDKLNTSVPEYADPVISFLDPKGVLVSNRLFRDVSKVN
ncbi:hypothetical protein AX774_g1342 [Zancudomyces culisetae]|uniref:Uncharacterized protein n=1 Tax=Zancudomyces culisetae TaxID=1213189 RepID=A0A1R1PW28_ZANCU|nr:hypothetical protein AX774_g1342 [Zancudomyces culisetae]|eukprot:OMH85122.1 hypothetical protein AX774_g1342 [Zancudomyces culisetae]